MRFRIIFNLLCGISFRKQDATFAEKVFHNLGVVFHRGLPVFDESVSEFSGGGFEHFLRSNFAALEIRHEQLDNLNEKKIACLKYRYSGCTLCNGTADIFINWIL
jgi:hypothetical protein